MDRSIIHLNIADFAAAVETNIQPSLKGYPLIIAPLGAPRAVVYDMSDEAYCQGIRKGMPLARAIRLNKRIKVLPPVFHRYECAMKDLLKEALAFTPLIESGACDGHIFMDVTGSGRLFGPSENVAFKLKKAFKKAFNFDPIWSVASNKLVAKVATRVVKPAGEYIVLPGDEQAFLGPLPIHLIPGLVKTDLARLHEFNLFSVSQARALTLDQLRIPFQHRAPLIYNRIRGLDPTPVTLGGESGATLSADHEFIDDTNDVHWLRSALYLMVETIGRTLRKQHLFTAAATLTLSYSDGLQGTAHQRLSPSTSSDRELFDLCRPLLDRAWTRRVRIRHMRLTCGKLLPAQVQATLFSDSPGEKKQTALTRAVDRIREKFGIHSVQPALTLMGENRP